MPLAELVRENDTALLAHEGGSVQFGKPGTNMSFSNYSCATFNEFRRDTKRPRTHILTVLQSAMFFGPRYVGVLDRLYLPVFACRVGDSESDTWLFTNSSPCGVLSPFFSFFFLGLVHIVRYAIDARTIVN